MTIYLLLLFCLDQYLYIDHIIKNVVYAIFYIYIFKFITHVSIIKYFLIFLMMS